MHGYRLAGDAILVRYAGRTRFRRVGSIIWAEGNWIAYVENDAHVETTMRAAVEGFLFRFIL